MSCCSPPHPISRCVFHCCRTPWKLSFTTSSSTQKVSTCPLVPPTLPSRPPRYARKNYYFISFKFCNSLNLNFPHVGECKTYYFISFEFCNSLILNFPHLGRVWRVLGVGWHQQAVPLQSEGPRLPSSGETAILFILKLGM